MIRYDESLPTVVKLVEEVTGPNSISNGDIRFLRDASGVISIIDRDDIINLQGDGLVKHFKAASPYIDIDDPIISSDNSRFDEELKNLSFKQKRVPLLGGEGFALVAERRIIGSDWLRSLNADDGLPPIYAFCSLKGGVGRSTALCIAADAFSRAGLKVLAVDLDLEAPGLGSLLLPTDNLPRFGTLDFFAERGHSRFQKNDFGMLFEASPFFKDGAPVHVAPAIGVSSIDNPGNVVGKLARAYVEDMVGEEFLTFAERTRILLKGICQSQSFDVVFLDARAGMHETTAASILGLDANVLLFGGMQRQTIDGYRFLLSQIADSSTSSRLVQRLQMVQSRADLGSGSEVNLYRDMSHKLFASLIYDRPEQTLDDYESGDVNWFNVDDSDAPHYPWLIADSPLFRIFEPGSKSAQLSPDLYGEAFDGFTKNLMQHFAERYEAYL